MAIVLTADKKLLLEKAKKVLSDNWVGLYTKPSPKLYPHQWNWDSAFIAIGYSHYDQEKAQSELLSLFKGQMPNGMLPHIIFNPEYSSYFPGYAVWKTKQLTSGITQPPIQATAALKVYKNAINKNEAKNFLIEIFPKIRKAHQYLHKNRDPKNEGLVYIHHPWESGLDNLPIWDKPLKQVPVKKISKNARQDLKVVDGDQRPSNDDYGRYMYLVDLYIGYDYDDKQIYEKSPFLVQDVLFNSILHQADKDLVEIAGIVKKDHKEIDEWIKASAKAVNGKLISRKNNIYYDYDLVAKKQIEVDTAAGFVPMYASIPSKKTANSLYEHLNSSCFCHLDENCLALPNYSRHANDFDTQNYWRGPIWINMNWLLYGALRNYGLMTYAKKIKQSVAHLVQKHGFYEYFDPEKDYGYGSENFSWTAALLIDFLLAEEKKLKA